MATKEKTSSGAPGPKAPKSESKKKKGGEPKTARGPHAGAGTPAPPPGLREFYQNTVRANLMKQFGLTNPHQVPTMTKIVLNVGAGEAIKQPKFLDNIREELRTITGPTPVPRTAKENL